MNKSEQTRARILEAALELFRHKGFGAATMREVAAAAGMATGAAYYYFDSKEAIVLAFYERAREEMAPLVEEALTGPKKLDERLRALITVKLSYFAPNRKFLGALLGSTADPESPLSPFSAQTAGIREFDTGTFERALRGSDVAPPADLVPHLPTILWLYQMSLIFFWLTDASPSQERTHRLLEKSSRMLVQILKLAGLPLMRPVRKSVLELVEIVRG